MYMKPVLVFLSAAVLLAGCASDEVVSTSFPSVVPAPVSMEAGSGSARITRSCDITICGDSEEMEYAAQALCGFLGDLFGGKAEISMYRDTVPEKSSGTSFVLSADSSMAGSGYRLEAGGDTVAICGGDAAGCFYAVQTLRQLVPAEAYSAKDLSSVSFPEVAVTDCPAMEYRGMMLDVARHFFSVDQVKEVLDIMALHKLNVFHWHLTDDQGWRIEIDAYPELVRIGSVRKRTIIGKDPGGEYDETTRYDETPYGGYYTKEQIRDIVSYAAERFITVIPEIEFPGHAVAALASYPWLGCTGEQFDVRQTWDIDDRVFCIGRESTFEFMDDVLSEVMDLFPSEYIHIGGDECPDKMWRKCSECNRRMKEEGLKSYRALQGYGIARIGAFLESHGRHLIGWDEILDAGITPSSIVMSWRGTEGGIKAAGQGNRVIMCPTEYCYFDYYQSPDTENEPLAWGGLITLEKAYSFNPYEGLDEAASKNVLGVQANLWTEYISTQEGLEYMMLPRLAALSETGWSMGRKDWDGFRSRIAGLEKLYSYYGYCFADYAQNEE